MLAVFHVCAEFMLSDGTKFTVGREKRNQFVGVNDEVKNHPFFRALVADGFVETPEDDKMKKTLGMEPTAGVSPEGKKVTAKNAVKVAAKKAGAEGKKQVVEVKPETAEAASANPVEAEKK